MKNILKELYDIYKLYFSTDTKQNVYHYTTKNGLLGILQSESLWFTDTRYLNDCTCKEKVHTNFS